MLLIWEILSIFFGNVMAVCLIFFDKLVAVAENKKQKNKQTRWFGSKIWFQYK